MSIRYISKRRRVQVEEMHCDGPLHQGETFMQCDTITLEHGYPSPMDGDTQHFCSLRCLKDWVRQLEQE